MYRVEVCALGLSFCVLGKYCVSELVCVLRLSFVYWKSFVYRDRVLCINIKFPVLITNWMYWETFL